MTRDEKIIRNKVGVLELARQLGSVSQACRIMGFSRDSFYRFRDLYEKGGEAALIEMSRRVPNRKNRVAEAVERRVLELVLEQPAWGHTRMANELAKEGIRVSPTGVRGVLVRHDLNTMAKRLKALEAKVAQDGLILTEDQLAALEKAATRSGTNTNCILRSRTSITAGRKPRAHKRMGSASASTRPCWMSSTGLPFARSFIAVWPSCRPTWTSGSATTMRSAPTRVVGATARHTHADLP